MTAGGSLLNQAETKLTERVIPEALLAFDIAERAGADPDRCSAGRWMGHMLLGQYEQAWQESDRIRGRNHPDSNRFWTGEAVAGKRVLVRCLHGFGDTVQYLRWLPHLRARASEVFVQAAPQMLPLLRLLPDAEKLLSWHAPGESDSHLWDVQVESAELPYLFRTTPETLPAPARIAPGEIDLHRVRKHLGPQTKPRVGLVWTGSDYDSSRSVPFEEMRSLLDTHAVEFWSLQAPGDSAAWLRYNARRGWSPRTVPDGLDQLALYTSEMDLVVTVDTLAAHIAGSLQVPTWLLLKREADWRWMLDRDDTPWYPTVRLFRQRQKGDWTQVLQQVGSQLRDWCDEQRP